MKLKVLALAALFLAPSAHAGMFSKMIAKVANMVAPKAEKVDTLAGLAVTPTMDSNLQPKELGTAAQDFLDGWKTGGDMVTVMFSKTDAPATVSIDGTVTIDGKPAKFMSAGLYCMGTDANPAPRRVEITTKKGDKAAFTLEPSAKKIKLLSVNGETGNEVALDLTKDVVLELEGTNIAKGDLVKVGIAVNQVGIKSIYDLAYVKFAPKVTIPAGAFRNINIKPAADAMYSYKKSYLNVSIESVVQAKDVTGAFTSVQYINNHNDGKLVTVKKEPELNLGLAAKGNEGEVDYDFYKPNAFASRPVDQLKKIGLLSFGLNAATIEEKSVITQEKDNSKEKDSEKVQITKTTTVTFPKQTDAAWDAVLAKLHPQIVAIIKEELGAEVLPLEATTKTAGYKAIAPFAVPEMNTDKQVTKTFGGAKLLAATPMSLTFGVNSANERIMKEAGADALMTVTLDLHVEEAKGGMGAMVPSLKCELAGRINGATTQTQYFNGKVSGKGVPSKNIGYSVKFSNQKDPAAYNPVGTITAEELDTLVRRSELLNTFRKGLKELKAKELANPDYKTVWNLQSQS